MAVLFAGTVYFVQKREAITEQRSKATSAVSCEYEINIPSPTETVSVPPIATPTIPELVCNRRADIAIAIDRSTSMGQKESNGKTKIELARDASRAFVSAIKESETSSIKISVVSFGRQGNDGTGSLSHENDATLHIGASSDYDAVLAAIDGITNVQSGTCAQCGIRIGNGQIASSQDTKAMILLTDGISNRTWNGSGANATAMSISEADEGRGKGIVYFVFGFGNKTKNQIDEPTLQAIAGSTGQYIYKPDPLTWTAGFLDLLPKFCTPATP